MIHGVTRPGEIECQQCILLGAGTIRGVCRPRLGPIPAVLDLLDEATDVVLDGLLLPEADLLRWYHLVGICDV